MATTKVTKGVIADNAVGIDQLDVTDGSNGQVLSTDGSGTLSFSTVTSYTDSDVESYLDTNGLTLPDNVKAQFGASNDLQIFHDGTHSFIQDTGTGDLIIYGTGEDLAKFKDDGAVELYYDGSLKIATTSTGIDVTGNITASGTVDGRDLATDGTKLDGIEANATADQTQSEINALGITATGLSGTPNITVGTLQATSFSDGTISGVTFIDEDSFATNSSTRVPTQQSIKAYVDAQVAGVVDSAPAALDTLNELAAALGDDANFSTTTSTALGNRLRVDTASQGLTGTQQANAITNLGITATKAELNYVDGVTSNIQTQLDGKQASGSYLTGNQTITLSGDVSGSGTTSIAVTIADDSHNHIISNVDGLQTALDAKLASSSYTAADVLTKIKTVDGAGSGLDADLLDGQSSAYYATASSLSSYLPLSGGTVSGALSVSGNLDIAGAVRHIGDTNTYTQFHAADQWRVVTGGVERFEINNSATTVAGNFSVDGGTIKLDGNYPTGTENVALGNTALDSVSTGARNTAIGTNAGTAISTGTDNVAVGMNALASVSTGITNTAVGRNALYTNTGSANTGLGYYALFANTSASYNTAVGQAALDSNTTGASNTATGYAALTTATTGTKNVAFGSGAGEAVTTGSYNVFVGDSAGFDATDAVNNVFIGYECRNDNAGTSNQVVIGHQARSQGGGKFTVGTSTTTYSYLTIGGTSWSGSSDERLKKEIADSTAGLSFINDLRPVTYKWKTKGEVDSTLPHYESGSDEPVIGDSDTNALTKHGFIAQEVKTVLDNHPEVKEGSDIWEVNRDEIQNFSPQALIPMLVKSIQELSAKCDSLQSEINILKGE